MSDPGGAPRNGTGKTVAFQGRRTGKSAFALVNAQWSRALTRAGFRVVDHQPGGPAPDYVIHHDFETRFTDFTPPPGSRAIAVRTWDFGPLPPAWVEKINREFHQYWAYSEWIAIQARTAGVDPARIRVVPLGIDPALYTPRGPRLPLETDAEFVVLFVGGVSLRKGTDLLLDAWRKAFTRSDSVCLVLKDHSGDLFYREDHARKNIAALQQDPEAAPLIHLDAFLPEASLAALYRRASIAVFPYRAEGFCLPILEAMASGTPSIVPDFGACLDFCSERTSWLMPVRRIRLPATRKFAVALGFEEMLKEVDFCEVPVDTLARFLQEARAASAGEAAGAAGSRAARATAGAELARRRFTWEHSGRAVLDALSR